MTKKEIESAALGLVSTEKINWETATVQVTDKVSFSIRALIRQCRKNYYSVFNKADDELTGRPKTFIPLTESTVEAVVKNTDIDTKDVGFRAKNPDSIRITAVVRSIIRNSLDNIFFGEKLDELVRNLAIDGTVVWKTIEREEGGKRFADVKVVDLLNFYIDPNASSIHETPAVIERSVMLPKEVQSMKGWINTKDLGTKNVSRIDGEVKTTTRGETEFVEVFERWGEMPEYLITGKAKDKGTVFGRIVCSIDDAKVFLIETANKKPYEEVWYTRVPNRWCGRGVGEKLLMLQSYMNTIVNIRKNRAYVSQLGIFKIKKNRGITPQSISRLPTSGAILVDSMDDIEQFAMSEASQSSYSDENNIRDWTARVTQTFESVTGETLPASTTATSAALASKAGQSYFVFVKEGIGLFLQRWIKRQYMEMVLKNIGKGELIQIFGDPAELEEIDMAVIRKRAKNIIEDMRATGQPVDMESLKAEIQTLAEKRKEQGSQRFSRLDKKINPLDYDVQVQVTNEDLDKGVMLQNLTAALNVAPEFKEQIIGQMFDLMGIDFKPQKAIPEQTGENVPTPGGDPTEMLTRANTAEPSPRTPGLANTAL